MALLKKLDLLEGSPMAGKSRSATHESGRQNARQSIFPTGSPVALGQQKAPKLLSKKRAEKTLGALRGKLRHLLEAREQANKVYGDTYFENHYPKADKDLKTALDKKVNSAHSRLKAKEKDEPEKEEHTQMPTIQIVLNINK